MKRLIQFRVRDKQTNEIIGYERIGEHGHWEFKRLRRTEWLLGVMTDGQVAKEYIREQFTGRFDIDENEIYENDTVNFTLFNGVTCVKKVEWSINQGAWFPFNDTDYTQEEEGYPIENITLIETVE